MAMEEVIKTVLGAEAMADRVIQAANDEAAAMKRAVEEDTGRRLEEAQKKAQMIIENRVSLARAEADAEYQREIERAKGAEADFVRRNKKPMEKITEKITALMNTPEYRK